MTNEELIIEWNKLSPMSKVRFGGQYHTYELNADAWNKDYKSLSELKKKRILERLESFLKTVKLLNE